MNYDDGDPSVPTGEWRLIIGTLLLVAFVGGMGFLAVRLGLIGEIVAR